MCMTTPKELEASFAQSNIINVILIDRGGLPTSFQTRWHSSERQSGERQWLHSIGLPPTAFIEAVTRAAEKILRTRGPITERVFFADGDATRDRQDPSTLQELDIDDMLAYASNDLQIKLRVS